VLLASGEVWQDEVCTVIVMECGRVRYSVVRFDVACRGVALRLRGALWCVVVWCRRGNVECKKVKVPRRKAYAFGKWRGVAG
jgi:hypothetical protein